MNLLLRKANPGRRFTKGPSSSLQMFVVALVFICFGSFVNGDEAQVTSNSDTETDELKPFDFTVDKGTGSVRLDLSKSEGELELEVHWPTNSQCLKNRGNEIKFVLSYSSCKLYFDMYMKNEEHLSVNSQGGNGKDIEMSDNAKSAMVWLKFKEDKVILEGTTKEEFPYTCKPDNLDEPFELTYSDFVAEVKDDGGNPISAQSCSVDITSKNAGEWVPPTTPPTSISSNPTANSSTTDNTISAIIAGMSDATTIIIIASLGGGALIVIIGLIICCVCWNKPRRKSKEVPPEEGKVVAENADAKEDGAMPPTEETKFEAIPDGSSNPKQKV